MRDIRTTNWFKMFSTSLAFGKTSAAVIDEIKLDENTWIVELRKCDGLVGPANMYEWRNQGDFKGVYSR